MLELSESEQRILHLIEHNPFIEQAEIASQLNIARSTVAVHISQLVKKGALLGRGYMLPNARNITCIGGVAFNRKYTLEEKVTLATSNPAIGGQSYGGVIRNIAENLARLELNVSLVSIVGDDPAGRELTDDLQSKGIDTTQVTVSGSSKTAEYIAIFDPERELVIGVADMGIFEKLTDQHIYRAQSHIVSSDWVILDCNLPCTAIDKVIELKQRFKFQLAVDTVSVSKAKRLPEDLTGIDLIFTNRDEATSLLSNEQNPQTVDINEAAKRIREKGARGVVVTDGGKGHVVDIDEYQFRTPALTQQITNVSGAGDALVAGFIFALHSGKPPQEASHVGAAVSSLVVETDSEVRPDLSRQLLNKRIIQTQSIVSEVTNA